jgi:hypothetical protein
MGWDEGFLQSAVQQCTNLSGRIEDCPIFTLQDPSVYSNCKFPMPADQQSENLRGPLDTLPGNVKIQSGPAYAKGGSGDTSVAPAAAAATSAVAPILSYSPGSSIASDATFKPGEIFVASSSSSVPPPPPTSTLSPTPTPTPTPTLAANEKIVSTKYSTMGNEVLELVMVEEETTVYESVTVTATTTVTGLKRKRRDSHLRRHRHGGLS